CDNNKTGLVSNSQNNDDWPSPQIGLCPSGQTGPLGTGSCTVWTNNKIHDNNNPNVPGNGSGLSGGAPVGTAMVLGGSTYVTTDGDIGLSTMPHSPGTCFSIDSVPDGTDPPGIETSAAYQPSGGMCTSPSSGDQGPLAAEALCDTQLVFPCPGLPAASYPRPAAQFSLPPTPTNLASMPNPCAGVPRNPWCP